MKQWYPTDFRSDAGQMEQAVPVANATFLSVTPGADPGPVLQSGSKLDRFEIIRHLGSGRSAHVYVARDSKRGHEVALKVADLRPEIASTITARMQREIDVRHRILAHPHVLNLYDIHQVQVGGLDLLVLSMEYADGGDFRQWLNQARSQARGQLLDGLWHVLNAARGLAALHRAGVVHLDVKPENLLCVRGVWKVGDFDHAGMIEELTGRADLRDAGQGDVCPRGTCGYQSPEVMQPAMGIVDGRADIFSLGVVLRETLALPGILRSGKRRSNGTGPTRRLARILRRCLKEDPNHRIQLADHVIEVLEAELDGTPAGNGTERWPRQDRQWQKACRCLMENRPGDARRLCKRLLDRNAHHPGARSLLTDLDRQEEHVFETARQLVTSPDRIPVTRAMELARDLIDLQPNHEVTHQLMGALEQQVGHCRGALVEALDRLSSGDLSGFATALDGASSQDPENQTAEEACLAARDFMEHTKSRTAMIEQAVDRQRYRRALTFTHKHRRLLAKVTKRATRLLGVLDHGSVSPEGRQP